MYKYTSRWGHFTFKPQQRVTTFPKAEEGDQKKVRSRNCRHIGGRKY